MRWRASGGSLSRATCRASMKTASPNGIRRRGRRNERHHYAMIRKVLAPVRESQRCATLRNVTRWTIPWTNRATPDGSRRKR